MQSVQFENILVVVISSKSVLDVFNAHANFKFCMELL